jgi:hypothetical protein
METFKRYFLSPDAYASTVVFVVAWLFLPEQVSVIFSKDLFGVGISVLSTIFAIFIAALAFIASANDNEFIEFMQVDNFYSILMNSFKFVLIFLFVSLLVSVAFYAICSYKADSLSLISKWYMIIFSAMFSYSMVATLLATKDAINFSEYRIRYMEKTKARNKN